jgi:hypothetical protein
MAQAVGAGIFIAVSILLGAGIARLASGTRRR